VNCPPDFAPDPAPDFATHIAPDTAPDTAPDPATVIACRSGCGACCIAPSISSPIPGMPHGKKAGERCVQLTSTNACAIFRSPQRPAFCSGLKPSAEMCGSTRAEAIAWLSHLEIVTAPEI